MSISHLLDPTTAGESWKNLYVNNVTVIDDFSSGTITVNGPNPTIDVINSSGNINGSTINLKSTPLSNPSVFKQLQSGNTLIESNVPNSNISLLTHQVGDIELNPEDSGFVKLIGGNYTSGPYLLGLNASNNIINSSNLTGTSIIGSNVSINNSSPSLNVLNTTASIDRATVSVQGNTLLNPTKFQQDQAGVAILENLHNNANLQIRTTGNGDISLFTPSGSLSITGSNYSSSPSLLKINSNILQTTGLFNSQISSSAFITFSGTTDTISYATNVFHYSIFCGVVFFSLYLQVLSIGTSTGGLQIFTPIASSSTVNVQPCFNCSWGNIDIFSFGASYNAISGFIGPSSNNIVLNASGNLGVNIQQIITNVQLPGPFSINLSGFYYTSL